MRLLLDCLAAILKNLSWYIKICGGDVEGPPLPTTQLLNYSGGSLYVFAEGQWQIVAVAPVYSNKNVVCG